ncbi:DUF6286 domain-containing protein [Actinomadura sp. SCN-SB]|uniref:DUF6286 domain-containing protein n=1 Tax=Actinomadura sp. SCN-SB TaxID=3373092 RepID=UPI003751A4AA
MEGTLIKSVRPVVGAAGDAEDDVTSAEAHAVRRARRLAAREFRLSRAPLALVAALLLFGCGTIAAVEVVSALLGAPARLVPADRWAAGLRGTAWQDGAVRAVAVALVVLGAAMALPSLLPRRLPRVLPMRAADPRVAAGISRQAVRRSLAAATLAVPGIVRARVRMGGRFSGRVSVRATTRYRNPANITDLVEAAVTARLGELDLMDEPPVRVRLRWRKD